MCSETTKNIGLPHYEPTDHPDFLDEINKAYETIDAQIASLYATVSSQSETIADLNKQIGQLIATIRN